MRWRLLALMIGLLIGTFLTTAQAKSVEHRIKEDETVWFLAQVYYGDGQQYEKILSANHLSGPDKVKAGQTLKIPSVLFHSEQPTFQIRWTHLKNKRSELLALKRGIASEDAKTVTPTKPKTETVPAPLSPQDRAKAEVGGR